MNLDWTAVYQITLALGVLTGLGLSLYSLRSNRRKVDADTGLAQAQSVELLIPPLNDAIAKLSKKVDGLVSDNDVLKARNAEMVTAHATLLAEHKAALVKLAALAKKVADMELERTAQDQAVQVLGDKVKELERERLQLTAEVQDLRGGVQTLAAQLKLAGIDPRYSPPPLRTGP